MCVEVVRGHKGPGSGKAGVEARGSEGAGGARVRISDVGRAQGNEGAVARAQVYKSAAVETHDTIRAIIMSLGNTQAAVGEAHVTQGVL